MWKIKIHSHPLQQCISVAKSPGSPQLGVLGMDFHAPCTAGQANGIPR
jgi:hypothetical protein